jgi:hypothetical protein
MPASAGMGVISGSLRAAALDDGGGLVAGAGAIVFGDGTAAWLGWLVAGAGAVGAAFVGGGAAWLSWVIAGPGAGAVVVGSDVALWLCWLVAGAATVVLGGGAAAWLG